MISGLLGMWLRNSEFLYETSSTHFIWVEWEYVYIYIQYIHSLSAWLTLTGLSLWKYTLRKALQSARYMSEIGAQKCLVDIFQRYHVALRSLRPRSHESLKSLIACITSTYFEQDQAALRIKQNFVGASVASGSTARVSAQFTAWKLISKWLKQQLNIIRLK